MKKLLLFLLLLGTLVGRGWGMTPAEEKRLFEILGEIKGKLQQMDKRFEQLYTFLWIITGIHLPCRGGDRVRPVGPADHHPAGPGPALLRIALKSPCRR
ncbi:hypothetical protein FVE67_02570 [Thermosulfurimonas marina]|uniref:Uncharacterized protein n=1 Tax=Thermosulfurimonas marina TaxID=2047767 RepID=A0A6H1WRA1_9BACT|nr:hypothetical protein [Thermosulfurimonas marina]QJA05747.1 hypothetical protein FVE67_02570 [Thermosulfurimonas marina]